MGNKNYKARVEISLIVEIEDISAIHEDNASAIAEDVGDDLASRFVIEAEEFDGCFVKNWGVKCIEAIEEEEE